MPIFWVVLRAYKLLSKLYPPDRFQRDLENPWDVMSTISRPNHETRTADVLRRIRGEYMEMPGLRLTGAQAQRLWGLDREVCDALLATLVDANFLSRTRDGAFVRYDGGSPSRILALRTRAGDLESVA